VDCLTEILGKAQAEGFARQIIKKEDYSGNRLIILANSDSARIFTVPPG
jgi:hypothetical protein